MHPSETSRTADASPTRAAVTVVGATLPALLLAALGASHPHVLTPESATWWRDLHVVGLVLFPLLAVPPWLVVRGRGRVVEVAVVLLGLVYASFYTALDAIAGIGGGESTLAVGPGPWVSALFGAADRVVVPGVYAHLAACVLAAVTVVVTTRGPGLVCAVAGGVLVTGAAWSFRTAHIYYPYGVATMVVLAVGWALLALPAAGLVGRAVGGRPVGRHADH